MNLSIIEIVSEVLKDQKKAFEIALTNDILPARNRSLICPKCGHIMKYNENSDKWKCHDYHCNTSRSCTYPFNIPKDHFPKFLACLFFFSADIPIFEASKISNISSQIIERNYKQFREKVHMSYQKMLQTKSLSYHVQIDESCFGKRKYNRGRIGNGIVWIFGACDITPGGNVYMIPVVQRNANTLVPIIQSWCPPGCIINSDCWAAYDDLDEYGFTHFIVNHSSNFVNPVTKEHTQRIESLWNSAKNFLRKHHYNSHQHLEEYLSEWCFKYNNKYNISQIIKEISSIN